MITREIGQQLSGWFWSESVWLPPNVTWKDVQPHPSHIYYTQFSDLWYPIPAAALIVLVRYFFERRLFKPLGISLGLKATKHKNPPTNDVLEKEYQLLKSKKINKINSSKLALELGMGERQVDYWIKRRRLHGKPCTLDKFCETGWRWFYYSSAFIYGICCLWNKPWLWNIKDCWYNYPHHDVPNDVWWYYMFELAFYWSLTFTQFFDVKRKDFAEMFVHHITTIALLAFSWTCNLTRCGALVLVVHDFADIFLEAAKMCNYTNYQKACDIIFGVFTVAWIVTRLGLFPTWILYSTTIEAPQIVEMFPAYYIFNGLLSILLVLHTIWTYFILKLVYNAAWAKPDDERKDTRSDSSEVTLTQSDSEHESDTVGPKTNTSSNKHCSESAADAQIKMNGKASLPDGKMEMNGKPSLADGEMELNGYCNGLTSPNVSIVK